MEFIILRPLYSSARTKQGATVQGLQILISIDPCILKSNYYVKPFRNVIHKA